MKHHHHGTGEHRFELGRPPTGGSIWCELLFRGPQHNSWRVRIIGYQAIFPSTIIIYDQAGHVTHPRRGYRLRDQARDVVDRLVPLLLAGAESYRRTMGAVPPADGWIFNQQVAEWAYLNDSELAELADHVRNTSESPCSATPAHPAARPPR